MAKNLTVALIALAVLCSSGIASATRKRTPLPMDAAKLLVLLEDAVQAKDEARTARIVRTLVVVGRHGKSAVEAYLAVEPKKPSLPYVLEALSRMSPDMRLLAKPLLSHRSPQLRAGAAAAIDGADHKLLLTAFKAEKDMQVQYALIRSLASSDAPEVTGFLTAQLHAADPGARATSLRGLALRGDTESLPVIYAAVRDADPTVRRASIDTLGTLGTDESMQVLLDLLRVEDDPMNKKAVFDALRSLSGERLGDDPDAWKRWLDAGS